MVARNYRELIAWQTGEGFKTEIFRIVQSSVAASRDYKFRTQILEAARSVPANIAEGFLRRSPLVFAQFLSISLGSLGEAESRLNDGIQLEYFPESSCGVAFRFGRRCATATGRLRKSQLVYARKLKASARNKTE